VLDQGMTRECRALMHKAQLVSPSVHYIGSSRPQSSSGKPELKESNSMGSSHITCEECLCVSS